MRNESDSPRAAFPRALRSLMLFILFAALVLVEVPPLVGTGHAARSTTGQWTPDTLWDDDLEDDDSQHAVHLVLMPGSGSTHSRVLFWFNSISSAFRGREWAWNPGNEGCLSFPSDNFSEITVPIPSGVNIFCGSQVLIDRDIFIGGGTSAVTGAYGETETRIFRPGTGSAQGSWTDPGDMVFWRWYATSTSLRDSRTLITAGQRNKFIRMFGGKRDGSAPSSPVGDSLFVFSLEVDGEWVAPILPDVTSAGRPPLRRPAGAFCVLALGG